MKAAVNDVIGTTDGRYGTVRGVEGQTLTVESLPVLDIDSLTTSVSGESFEITQSQVASIR